MNCQGLSASRRMDPGASGDGGLLQQQIVDDLEREMEQQRNQIPHPTSCHSIYPFPDFLSGIEEGIRLPRLASFGPCYRGKDHLLPFEKHKADFRFKFLDRRNKSSRSKLVKKLLSMESNMRGCYYGNIDSITREDFVPMMLLDGSFIIELFYQHELGLNTKWLWYSDLNTLIADLLKLGNQLPFFVLQTLHLWSRQTGDEVTASIELKKLALSFFNQALGRPSDAVFQDRQQPWHLLHLFHSSFLPATVPRNNFKALPESIQCAELLCNAGITLRRKRANNLLEIDFRKLQIPPFALRIPPVAIDDLTTTMLVNCVAFEQCSHNISKHFTAYFRFMNCLVRQPEDLRFLRTANIVKCIQPYDNQYVINLLQRVHENVHFNVRDSYLWKQCRAIDSYYESSLAYIWCNIFARSNSLTVLVSILAAIIALCSWLFTWLLPRKNLFGSSRS